MRGRHALRSGVRRPGLLRRRRGRRDDDQPARHGRLHAARRVRGVHPARPRAVPRARERCSVGPLPRRPRAGGRELPGGRRRGRRPARVHGQRHRRARRERIARGDRDGDARARRPPAGAHRRRPLADRPDLTTRRAPHRRGSTAQQGDRGRERIRPRSRDPPGRAAEGRGDLPDHGSDRARPGDDAPARQALRTPRVLARVRRGRAAARRAGARTTLSPASRRVPTRAAASPSTNCFRR